jgi:flagellar protein FliO/FliZ
MKILLTNAIVFFLGMSSSIVVATEKKITETPILAESGFSDPNMAGNLLQTMFGLIVVIAVIGGAAWAFKRFGHFQTGLHGQMKVVGGLSLGGRERIVLLQVGEQQLVVGVTPSRIQTLHVLKEALSMDEKPEAATGFSMKLQAAMTNRFKQDKSGREEQ